MPPDALRILRNRKNGTPVFRRAARQICLLLTRRIKRRLIKDKRSLDDVHAVFILRSALAFLDAMLHTFPKAPIAVLGLKRDERTAKAHWYYENIPASLTKRSTVVIFDPMLATGGSAEETLKRLKSRGVDMRKTYFVCVIAAPEGIDRIAKLMPRDNILAGVVDEGLDAKKFIVPGLGDFGDRYFGTTAI